MEKASALAKFLKYLVFPGNLLRSPDPFAADHLSIFNGSLTLASERTESYDSLKQAEVLLAACWCILFGVIASVVLRRVHILALFGYSLFGGFLFSNQLMPTTQFGLMVACALHEKHEAANLRREEAALAAQADISVPPAAGKSSKGAHEGSTPHTGGSSKKGSAKKAAKSD
uniref:Uncharacterized protein n=2 Tax=Coccolithus braarudii TaxID=221442 RepID=A0A7S0L5L5_9EUKA|mmetsp:Transcript_21799/g.46946  ORF Transcript_21799/g.46946 Transcript_21799/m.46946 type:complete len:172 (+) Transcript_21799:32-547(+)